MGCSFARPNPPQLLQSLLRKFVGRFSPNLQGYAQGLLENSIESLVGFVRRVQGRAERNVVQVQILALCEAVFEMELAAGIKKDKYEVRKRAYIFLLAFAFMLFCRQFAETHLEQVGQFIREEFKNIIIPPGDVTAFRLENPPNFEFLPAEPLLALGGAGLTLLGAQNTSLLAALPRLSHNLPALLLGGAGAGKSFFLQQLRAAFRARAACWDCPLLRCDQRTTPDLLQRLLLDCLDKTDSCSYGPRAGYSATVVLIDDLNLPGHPSPAQELLRQVLSTRQLATFSSKRHFLNELRDTSFTLSVQGAGRLCPRLEHALVPLRLIDLLACDPPAFEAYVRALLPPHGEYLQASLAQALLSAKALFRALLALPPAPGRVPLTGHAFFALLKALLLPCSSPCLQLELFVEHRISRGLRA